MWKKKKFILIGLLVVAVLAGSIGAIAFAQTGTQPSANNTLLDRVAAKLNIAPQTLKDAFTAAQREIQSEALDKRLKDAVANGRMTQQQADQYKQWLNSRPEFVPGNGGFGMPGGKGGMMGRFGGMHPFAPRIPRTPAPGTTPS